MSGEVMATSDTESTEKSDVEALGELRLQTLEEFEDEENIRHWAMESTKSHGHAIRDT